MDGSSTAVMFGVVGTVILAAALMSGLLDRKRVPQVLIFLLLGTALGPFGFGVIDVALDSPTTQIVSTLGLVLVLFTDAVTAAFAQLRKHAALALITLGPGTLLTAVAIAGAAAMLLGTGAAESAILGAALASTDPVLLRGILRHPTTPDDVRTALRIESGMNDAVLLPVLIIAIAVLLPGHDGGGWVGVAARVLLVGAGAGVAIGAGAVWLMERIRRSVGMRRDYESLYALGVALTAFAAAEMLHGSGFIAAFAAGLTIAALDVDLCDCFFDYGEATAEMALLFTFVVLGSAAIWTGLRDLSPPVLAFATVALFVRGLILLPALLVHGMPRRSMLLLMWMGPRGLSSLLMVLLAVFAGVPGSDTLFATTSLVVLLSVLVHGGSQVLMKEAEQPAAMMATTSPLVTLGGSRPTGDAPLRITTDEVDALRADGADVVILDARSESSWLGEPMAPEGSIRIRPDRPVESVGVLNLPHDAYLVLYCT